MDELRRRFASLDAIVVPDLSTAIDRRAAALARRPTGVPVVPGTTLRSGAARQGVWGSRFAGVPVLLVLALLIAALITTVIVGAGWFRQSLTVPPSTPFRPTPPTPTLTVALPPVGVVAYDVGGRILVVNRDGTETRELVLAGLPMQNPLGWLADGSRLVYSFSDGAGMGIGLTDDRGSGRVTYDSICPSAVGPDDLLAGCVPEVGSTGMSPDGTRFAYAYWGWRSPSRTDAGVSAIAILDLATGRITTLDATATSPGSCETAGENNAPSWSTDGTSLLFTRDSIGSPEEGACPDRVLSVKADGGDFREIALPDVMDRRLPVWSPDGSAFFFSAGGDIHTGRVGFTDIRAVTSNGMSGPWSWTRDGRVIFIRWSGSGAGRRGDIWVTDADGGNSTQLEATVPALTAAGCMVCPYPVYGPEAVVDPLAVRTAPPYEQFWITTMYWQPVSEDRP